MKNEITFEDIRNELLDKLVYITQDYQESDLENLFNSFVNDKEQNNSVYSKEDVINFILDNLVF